MIRLGALLLSAAALASIVPAAPAAAQVLYRRPLAPSVPITEWRYYDHDRDSGEKRDWACRGSTYDQHRGTDFYTPGAWDKEDSIRIAMENDFPVVAAADGVVRYAVDGYYDRCGTGDGVCGDAAAGGMGNSVVIEHADGIRTYYMHMKRGSVAVSEGDRVTCGQVLGFVASSGRSSWAHLHFEPRPPGARGLDPFHGRCSSRDSRWTDQGTHRSLPGLLCDGATSTNRAPVLDPVPDRTVTEGELLAGTIYASDPDGDALTFAVEPLPEGAALTPADGSAAFEWTPAAGEAGVYRLTVTVSDGELSDAQEVTVTVESAATAVMDGGGSGPGEPPAALDAGVGSDDTATDGLDGVDPGSDRTSDRTSDDTSPDGPSVAPDHGSDTLGGGCAVAPAAVAPTWPMLALVVLAALRVGYRPTRRR